MKRVVTQETRDKISKSLKGVSVSPATQFKKGQKPSPLAIEKNRQRCGEKSPSWKGGKIQKECVVCGTPFSVYPYRETQAKTCSSKCMGKMQSKNRVGEKSSNWRGGTTPVSQKIRTSIEYDLWRKAIFERDNFTCQRYGTLGGKLRAHHINNFAEFPELRTSIENGITLSEKAHREFHRKYGIKNNTREQLEEFLNS